MGLGTWLICGALFIGSDGVKRMYNMPAQMNLDANDGRHYYVDFQGSLEYHGFDMEKNRPWIRLVLISNCHIPSDNIPERKKDEEENVRPKKFPENSN